MGFLHLHHVHRPRRYRTDHEARMWRPRSNATPGRLASLSPLHDELRIHDERFVITPAFTARSPHPCHPHVRAPSSQCPASAHAAPTYSPPVVSPLPAAHLAAFRRRCHCDIWT
ncbi:hypothetical protein BD779DRAFT_696623 [Infundibulicybe gibba]|nr:hypothetical protein BD779DRAFT_123476 [Infundibulicybe gibba]KAF8885219.1 hypothetical protein BD779DRAFT_696623 [Infundibulicybe gibba]